MRFKPIRIVSVLSILAVSLVFVLGRPVGSDPQPPPPSDCALTIKIDGHPGESMVERDAIDVDSFSWGVNRPSSRDHDDGRTEFSDFSFVKNIDKASPKLMLSSAEHLRVPRATFEARKHGRSDPYLTYILEDVVVKSFGPEGTCDGGQTPKEQVSLSFTKVTQEYTLQPSDGGPSQTERTCFDLGTRRGCN